MRDATADIGTRTLVRSRSTPLIQVGGVGRGQPWEGGRQAAQSAGATWRLPARNKPSRAPLLCRPSSSRPSRGCACPCLQAQLPADVAARYAGRQLLQLEVTLDICGEGSGTATPECEQALLEARLAELLAGPAAAEWEAAGKERRRLAGTRLAVA